MTVRIHDDLSQAVMVEADALPWLTSPMPGVERKMLFRIGDETARATSIVRYAPGASFSRHTHAGGEEILVLEGVFQDEHGDYPAGSYLRNPPGTSHVPASAPGCTIFVRLWQFRANDQTHIVRPADDQVGTQVLFDDGFEQVRVENCPAHGAISIDNPRGLELLLVSGAARIGGRETGARTWLRLPAGQRFSATAGPEGARLWVRDAPLLHPDVCAMA